MSSNPALYRFIDFIGGNILDASNVTLLQSILAGRTASTVNLLTSLGQLYQQGTLLNAIFNISGTSINFVHSNSSYPVYALINEQFESLGNTVSIGPTSQPASGASNPLYLNWSWDIKTSTDDPSFVDGITGEPTIQAGQLSFIVDWTDTSGTSLNPATQFAKNTSPIILATFNMNVSPIQVTYNNAVFPYVLANPNQAGLAQLSPTAVWQASTFFAIGQSIVDSNGNIQQVTANTAPTSGVTGGSVPSWNASLSGTTTDNVITWTNEGPAILGEAVNINDTSVTNPRSPKPGSVYNGSVAALISSGTNSSSLPAWAPNTTYTPGTQILDSNGNIETVVSISGTGTSGGSAPAWNVSLGGQTVDNAGSNQVVWVNGGVGSTTKYDPATAGQGGIFTDSIIYTTLKQKLTTFLDTVNTSIENTLIALGNHIGKPLGSSETHPFPTAFQVGAAPASHVGQVLGLGTSHPASVSSDTSGFTVNEVTSSVSGDAYALSSSTSVRKAAITHSGDLFSLLANAANAQGGNGSGGTAVFTGTLGLVSLIANVLAEHVNYKSHGNNNPHNLDAADIGSVDAAFVDQQVSSIIADVTAYTDSKTNISVRIVTTPGPTFPNTDSVGGPVIGTGVLPHNAAGNTATTFPITAATITNVIINFGGFFEVAIGEGWYASGQQIALPEFSGWNSSNFYATAGMAFMTNTVHDGRGLSQICYVPNSTRILQIASAADETGEAVFNGIAGVHTICYRNLTPPCSIISSFDTVANTFNAGHVGDQVVITGRNFGASQGGSTVTFNGVPVTVYTSWASNSLTVNVPTGATTGVIVVTVAAVATTSPFVFTIS